MNKTEAADVLADALDNMAMEIMFPGRSLLGLAEKYAQGGGVATIAFEFDIEDGRKMPVTVSFGKLLGRRKGRVKEPAVSHIRDFLNE